VGAVISAETRSFVRWLQSAERRNSSMVLQSVPSLPALQRHTPSSSQPSAHSAQLVLSRGKQGQREISLSDKVTPKREKINCAIQRLGRCQLITEIVGDNRADDERRLFRRSHSLHWLYRLGQPPQSQVQRDLFNVKVHSADQSFRQYMIRFISCARKIVATNVPSIMESSTDSVSRPKSHDKRKNLEGRGGRYVRFPLRSARARARACAA
jgi:hypothetical protein